MNKLYPLIFLFLPLQVFSQAVNDSAQYYPDGKIKTLTRKIDKDVTEFVEYYRNGITKDSMRVRKETPIGVQKTRYKNGNLKYMIRYEDGLAEFRFAKYRPDGSIKATGGIYNYKQFGHQKAFNKKGEVIRFQDLNDGRMVRVPSNCKKGKHLKRSSVMQRFTIDKGYLERSGFKSRTIKTGALISIRLKTDTAFREHQQVEGFSMDSLLLSSFDYDLTLSKNTLEYRKTYAVHLNDIDTLMFGANNVPTAEAFAMGASIAGYLLLADAVVLVPVFGGLEALAEPLTISFLAGGPALFLESRHIYKMSVPKPYNLKEWKLATRK